MPLIDVSKPPPELIAGAAGEMSPRAFYFDVASWKTVFPGGLVSVAYRRPDLLSATTYVDDSTDNPVILQLDADAVSASGTGEIILVMSSGGEPVRSLSISTYTPPSLSGMTVNVNVGVAPALGTLAHNNEYRCTNASLTAAPTMTIPVIVSTAEQFSCAVSFKAPNATAPEIVNNSGYALKFSGTDVSSGTWTPVAGAIYRMGIAFNGLCVNVTIS
jgi:hypothetical protein